jgi:threonine/homoserine/homoserine lactone efflux protein
MSIYLLIEGIMIGLVVAVPVGPLGLLCINRALMLGPLCGLCSGLGVATADAIAAGIAALGITLISDFLADHQMLLRFIGGIFLCYLGYKIYRTEPMSRVPINTVNTVNGLLSAFSTTFVLTLSNPVTILSFVAIYAGWHVPSLQGHYAAAATLTAGVFTGSTLWWVGLFLGLTAFHEKFNLRFLFWVHRVSGAVIATSGIIVLLSLSPLNQTLRIQF